MSHAVWKEWLFIVLYMHLPPIEIRLSDRAFYGVQSDEESSLSHIATTDSGDEYLSPNKSQDAIGTAARGLAHPGCRCKHGSEPRRRN